MNLNELTGLGPKKLAALNKNGIFTCKDLLYCFPKAYQDRRGAIDISLAKPGEDVLICGFIDSIFSSHSYRGGKNILKLNVSDESGSIEIVFFHGQYIKRLFKKGDAFYFFGRVSINNGKKQIIHPEFFNTNDKNLQDKMGIIPVYSESWGISQLDMRSFLAQIFNEIVDIPDYLDEDFKKKYGLINLYEGLKRLHFPREFEDIQSAKQRFLYENMLMIQLGKQLFLGDNIEQSQGVVINGSKVEDYCKELPFELTNAQERVINEVLADLNSDKAMNRLIQGDVGSGKTAVAKAAIFAASTSGYQSAYMMPTEILAKQQYKSIKDEFNKYGIEVGLLVGSLSAKEKAAMTSKVSRGEVLVVVGTHALIQESVKFKNLGLTIVDEQHRFGVKQRSLLREKGNQTNCLVMTATPIPRTLALILFGDMDISIIDQLPEGRKQIRTKAITEKKRDAAYDFLKGEIVKGRQGYVVAPLIEESEKLEGVKSAVEIFEELKVRFNDNNVALLHGEMSGEEKETIMSDFSNGDIDILVSTVVIEVGINVPNATVIIIENSERFGLSQLHQLRGRVGRSNLDAYCILILNSKSDVALNRAKTMVESQDGFYIAEEDLKLRGPGEFFGTRQHGVPSELLKELAQNPDIFEVVNEDAKRILEVDPGLENKEHEALKLHILEVFDVNSSMVL